MGHWLHHALYTYLAHPLRGDGYAWWSGAGSDLGEITLIGVALAALRHINCEQPGCWRTGHRHPDHGRPVCRRHYRTVKPPSEEFPHA